MTPRSVRGTEGRGAAVLVRHAPHFSSALHIEEIAENHAEIVNTCDFDGIYLDAIDGSSILRGPDECSYWAEYWAENLPRLRRGLLPAFSMNATPYLLSLLPPESQKLSTNTCRSVSSPGPSLRTNSETPSCQSKSLEYSAGVG